MADLSTYLLYLTLPRLRQIARDLDLDAEGNKDDIVAVIGNVVTLEDLSTSDLRTIARNIGIDPRGTTGALLQRLSYVLPNVPRQSRGVRGVEQVTFLPGVGPRVVGNVIVPETPNLFLPGAVSSQRAIDRDLWQAANIEAVYDDVRTNALQRVVDATTKTCVTACSPKQKPILFDLPKEPVLLTNLVSTGPAVPERRLRVLGFPYKLAPADWQEIANGRPSMCYTSSRDMARNDYVYVLIDSADNRPLATLVTVSALPGSNQEATVSIKKMCTLDSDPRLSRIYLSTLLRNALASLKERGFKLVYTTVPKTILDMQPEELLASVGFRRYTSTASSTEALMVYVLGNSAEILAETFPGGGVFVAAEFGQPTSKVDLLARRIAELVLANTANAQLLDTLLATPAVAGAAAAAAGGGSA